MKNLRSFILGGILVTSIAWAGTGNIAQIVTSIVQRAHVNDIRSALYQDLVPRDASGTTTSLGGNIGTATYQWLKARIASGYWQAGDIKIHHTYNGAVGIGEGWMLMDGRQITQANYDTEHGSGHWATYVGSSTLVNKYLPNMSAKYTVGAATTTQDGSIAITFSGNASNQVNLQHTHSHTLEPQAIYVRQFSTTDDQIYSDGTVIPNTDPHSIARGTAKNSLSLLVGNSTNINATLGANTVNPPAASLYTSGDSTYITTGNGGSTTQSIQPESLQVVYYMRVID